MAETLFLADPLLERLETVREQVQRRPWRELSREAFVYLLRQGVEGLEGIAAQLEALRAAFQEKPLPHQPDLAEHLRELNATLVVFKRNLKLEEAKPLNVSGHSRLSESREQPELYASLEDKLAALLTKTVFLCERINLHGRRQADFSPALKGAPKGMLVLLEQKEAELEETRKKFLDLRGKSFFGAGETAAGLERELMELNARLQTERALLQKDLESSNREINSLLDRQLEFDRKLQSLNDVYAEHAAKSLELTALLKQESGYARRALLDAEQDLARQRSTYSRGLLGVEEAKLAARKEGRAENAQELERLRLEVRDKNQLLKDFREMVDERESELAKLKEKRVK
ncbi:MAG TPA: hypothetical protein HA252_03315 [Candidatus Diapherotrites archaeon]|uniref:Uncharacterized protein n=1 Tax=Candidatus Iainarchaeum sp. TaxID=3101447 RepID=A0A7J4JII0_9ARCH|nr:hypothetical protein [Candidatus Diapherotrites archaeon]